MKKHRTLWIALVFLLTAVGALSAAASNAEVEDARDQVEQAEAKAKDIREASERFRAYLEELNQELDQLTEEMEELALRRAEVQASLETTAAELEEARETEAVQYEAMKKRIQYMYENRDAGFIGVIFSEESLSTILNKAEYAMEMAQYDREMLTAYQETKELVARKENDLLTEQTDLDQLVRETEEKQNEVLIAIAETSQKMEDCAGELEDAEGQLAQYRSELQKRELEAEERMAELAEQEKPDDNQVADGTGSNAKPPAIQPEEPEQPSPTESTAAPDIPDEKPDTPTEKPDTPTEKPDMPTQAPTEPADPQPTEPEDEFDYSVYSDLELMAAMIYREANMEPWEGKVAVGNVIMNRINSSRYPNTMIGVLSQPYQFTPWGYPKYQNALKNGVNSECTRAAQVAMSGSENYIGDLLHFRTVKEGYEGIIIGTHVFY